MSRPFVALACALLALGLAVAVAVSLIFRPPELPRVSFPADAEAHMPDIIPWREPAADVKRFFPGATSHRPQERILSGARLALIRRLGRQPTGEEGLLRMEQVFKGSRPLGAVVVRRVKGSQGAIELAIATDVNHRVRGVRLQREREGPARERDLARLLSGLRGKSANGNWELGKGLPAVASDTEESARAIIDGVRVTLILLETADVLGIEPSDPHH